MVSHFRQIRVRVGPEVSEADERLAAGVLEGDSFGGPLGGDEHLILGHLAESDEVGAIDGQLADGAAPLDDDQAIRPRILDRGRAARLDGQLAGAEELLAVDAAVDDPLIDVARIGTTGADDRLEVVVLLELGIDVLLPVELLDEVVEVVVDIPPVRP